MKTQRNSGIRSWFYLVYAGLIGLIASCLVWGVFRWFGNYFPVWFVTAFTVVSFGIPVGIEVLRRCRYHN